MTIERKGPPPLASGRNGRWVMLGSVGVDSAALGVSDPSFVIGVEGEVAMHQIPAPARSAAFGSGVQFWCGFGDGIYEVWGWVADYGTEGEVDERIAQVVVTMIDHEILRDWYDPNSF